MSSKLKVLQVIPRLGYGGAEIGCYDLAHYLKEQKSSSFIATSGGELLKYIDKKKVKLFRLPVHSKNPLLILINIFILTFIVLFYKINILHVRSRAPAWSCYYVSKITRCKLVTTFHGTYNFNSSIKKKYNAIMQTIQKIANLLYSADINTIAPRCISSPISLTRPSPSDEDFTFK